MTPSLAAATWLAACVFAEATWSRVVASARDACLTAAVSAAMTASGAPAVRSAASCAFASASAADAWEMASRPDDWVWDRAFRACVSWVFACVTPSLAFALVVFETGISSAASFASAAARFARAIVRASSASSVSAAARTSPALTASPALTFTLATVHSGAVVFVAAVATALGDRTGGSPNARPKESTGWMDPLIDTVSRTSITDAAAVR